MTAPATPTSTQQGTSGTGGVLNSGSAVTANPLNNIRPNAQFPTLNPPPMGTLVYAPDVQILIATDGIQRDVSSDIIRGQVVRKENSASSLFVTLGNQDLRYNATFHRMDRIACFLTRIQPLQVFAGYLDTIPWMQAYPGTVDIRATCTLKRLLHTWWNPALPSSQAFFQSVGPGMSDGQTDSGIGGLLQTIMQQVGMWTPNTIHVQDFPTEFITFLNNYMTETNMYNQNQQQEATWNSYIVGDDQAPGPMGNVGYNGADPVGSPASITNDTPTFYLQQICAAVDQRGMGPIVDQSANSTSVAQAADTLESAAGSGGVTPSGQSLAAIVHQAGTQLGQYSSNWTTQNTNSDAAILATACMMVESGAGTPAITMQANPADPPTLTFYYNAERLTGTGSGLFNQQNNGNWGTAAQRMNPLSSAGMFLDALNAQTGWRNMQGGQAIWQVQQSAPSQIPLYQAAIAEATTLVQAYRTSQTGATSSANNIIGQVPGAGSLTTLMGGGNNPIGSAAGMVASSATTSPVSTAVGALQVGQPNPNSEGAINAALSMVGTPYQWGGATPHVGLDCSGMVMCAFGAIGLNQVPHLTTSIPSTPGIQSIPVASAQRGDILLSDYQGHTGIYLGSGLWIQTGGPAPIPMPGPTPIPTGASGICWAGRMCQNGGTNPAAPFTLAAANPATGQVPGTGAVPGGGGGAGGGTGNEPIARNLFSYIFEPQAYATAVTTFFTGQRAYIDDVPLMQTITALCQASMRNFQSSPTGDFMAYYPDPFGMDGKPAILALEDIELKDCHIDLSDDNLTTHVYIEGDYTMVGQADQTSGWIGTCGVATVQNSFLYQRLIAVAPGDMDANMSAQQLMNTYGVRPYKNSFQIAGNAGLEFYLACSIFMGKWASQYETDIGLTFMPELFPGMRVLMVGHNLTVYVSQVTHEFDWERGFRTTATVSAPANPGGASYIYSSLPGFLNSNSTNPGSNTTTFGQAVNSAFQAALAGGPLDMPADTYYAPLPGDAGTSTSPTSFLGGG